MKKTIITLSLLLGFQLSTFAYNIISIERINKGLFGYDYVAFDHVTESNGHSGYIGRCYNPGLSRCKIGRFFPDKNDDKYANELLDLAEGKIDNGTFTGSESVTIHVDGESFNRIYSVTWSTDNQGNGTIKVDRTDV